MPYRAARGAWTHWQRVRWGEGERLEGAGPTRGDLCGVIYDPHSAPAYFTQQAEVAEHATGWFCRLRPFGQQAVGFRARQVGHETQGGQQAFEPLGVIG